MKPSQHPPRLRLRERDAQILRRINRYGMATVDSLHASVFQGQGREAVKSTLKRLCGRTRGRGLLMAEPLDARRVYYRLTVRGARLIGLPRHRARSLGLRARAERFAVLYHAEIAGRGQRSLFNPRDFPEQFPIRGHRLPRSHFCIEEAEERTQLEYLIVDYQSDSRRIVRRATEVVERFLKHGWFDRFLQSDAMTMTLLTTSVDREKDLFRRISEHWQAVLPPRTEFGPFGEGLPFPLRTATVPGLIDLLLFRDR